MRDAVRVVVLAGGSGVRFGAPKQLQVVSRDVDDGVTPIDLVLGSYQGIDGVSGITVVHNAHLREPIMARASRYPKVDRLVAGGETRQDSARIGAAEGDERWVLIHDAARPLVCVRAVEDCVGMLRDGCRAVAVVFPTMSGVFLVRDGEMVEGLDRKAVMVAQCPQGFDAAMLREAQAKAAAEGVAYGDECYMFKAHFPVERIRVVTGWEAGMKLTRPDDLRFLRAFMSILGDVDGR
jgi:2-C-methyl-D-erythritol 4-phosphate cytidylyltransferase